MALDALWEQGGVIEIPIRIRTGLVTCGREVPDALPEKRKQSSASKGREMASEADLQKPRSGGSGNPPAAGQGA